MLRVALSRSGGSLARSCRALDARVVCGSRPRAAAAATAAARFSGGSDDGGATFPAHTVVSVPATGFDDDDREGGARVVAWSVAVGDAVAEGDELCAPRLSRRRALAHVVVVVTPPSRHADRIQSSDEPHAAAVP